MTTLFYATGNANKFETARDFFAQHCPHIELKQLTLDLPERQTHDQKAISQEKALAAWRICKAPVLADDAGVYFDAYQNFPGFMTKYVWESLGVDGIMKLLTENNAATFKIFLTYCNGPDQMHTVIGSASGTCVSPHQPIPANSGKPFLYFFVPNGYALPYMQLAPQNQNTTTSFRLNGLHKFSQWYNATHPSASNPQAQ